MQALDGKRVSPASIQISDGRGHFDTYNEPVAKSAETPSFFFVDMFKSIIASRGIKRVKKSVKVPTAPKPILIGGVSRSTLKKYLGLPHPPSPE